MITEETQRNERKRTKQKVKREEEDKETKKDEPIACEDGVSYHMLMNKTHDDGPL